MGKLGTTGITLNRKMLAEIAISDPVAFQKIASA
jgi:ribosomal protein L20